MRKPRPAPDPAAKPPRRKPLKVALVASAAVLAFVAVGGVVLYSQRGPIGTRLAVDYLAKRGVPAHITIDRLDAGGFTGSMKLGPQNDPDLTVERIEVEFEPIFLFRQGLTAPRIRNMRLVRPRLKGRYDGAKLSFGTLQPMIDEILAQPLVQPGPSFRVEEGELRLATPYGPTRLTGDATIDEGRLKRAMGHLAATTLALPSGLKVKLAGADFDLQGRDDRLAVESSATLDGASGPVTLGATRLALEASLPYGEQGFARLDGPIAAALTADSARAEGQGIAADRLRLTTRLSGTASGPVGRLVLDLSAEAQAGADAATGPQGARAAKPSADLKAAKLHIDRQGARNRISGEGLVLTAAADRASQAETSLTKAALGLTLDKLQADSEGERWSLAAPLKAKLSAARLNAAAPAGRLSLPALTLTAGGDAAFASDKPPALALSGAASTGAGGFERAAAADLAKGMAAVADEARVRAALSSFRINAPAWRIALAPAGVEARLDRPLALTAAGGVSATLASVSGRPLLKTDASGGGSGGAAFKLAGQGLPRLQLTAARYSLSKAGRLRADLAVDAGLDGGEIKGAAIKGAGGLDAGANGLSFTPRGCLQGSVMAFGPASAPTLQDAGGKLCGLPGRPLFAADSKSWRAAGRVQDGAGKASAAQVAVQGADLGFDLAGRGETRTGKLTLAALRVVDTQPAKRFQPVGLTGDFTLGAEALTGRAVLRNAAKGAELAAFDIRQSVASPEGRAEIVSDLAFVKGGLQPVDLTPLSQGQIADADMKLHFVGHAAWSDKGLTDSGGRLTTTRAAFKSAYGPITGAAADITLSSLMPLLIPPGQTVTAEQLTWIAPLTDIRARFGLTETSVSLQEAGATVAHGRVSLEPMTAPLDPKAELKGVLTLANVDLGELVANSTLADSVTVQAKINGSLPFQVSAAGFRLTNGVVAAVGAGRLSIKRQALTGAVATAGSAGAQPNAVQDFAYQALENLAFDTLDAKLESRPEGRLGAVFHLVGRNDPPGSPKARVGVLDVLRGTAFNKHIDLPKGTPVDLTLDTSLNFDDLLKAYGEYNRRGSAAVQP